MSSVKTLLQPKNCSICGRKLRGPWNSKLIGGGIVCRECTSLMRVSSLRIPYLTISEAEELVMRGRKNKEKIEAFNITTEVISCDYRFRVDDAQKEWYITNTKRVLNPQIYNLSDILSYQLFENGTLVKEKKRGYRSVSYSSPDYSDYARLYSYRFVFEINGMDEPLEIELINDNAKDVLPGSRMYYAYIEEANNWTDYFEKILE